MQSQEQSHFLCLYSGLYLLISLFPLDTMLYFHRNLIPRAFFFLLLCSVFSNLTVPQVYTYMLYENKKSEFFLFIFNLGDRNEKSFLQRNIKMLGGVSSFLNLQLLGYKR